MDATLIIVDGDAELARAQALVAALWNSADPVDLARLEAQARLIAAYEQRKWPLRSVTTRDLLTHLLDQHDVSRAEIAKLVGGAARFRDIMAGKAGLGVAAVRRLRSRFGVSADVLFDAMDVEARRLAAA
jgi:HTH-type transcriptional regulator / antitoxin HigA